MMNVRAAEKSGWRRSSRYWSSYVDDVPLYCDPAYLETYPKTSKDPLAVATRLWKVIVDVPLWGRPACCQRNRKLVRP